MIENFSLIKQTIIVPAYGFVSWNGGVDYLKYQLRLLIQLQINNPSVQVILYLPELSVTGKIINLIKLIIKCIIHYPIIKSADYNSLLIADHEIINCIKIQKYYYDKKYGRKSIQYLVKKEVNPIVFPTMTSLPYLKCKQIGYIYDLQHISLPNLFTEKECNVRNINFRAILCDCDGVIVNSKDVKRHILKIYPEQANDDKIFSAPPLPVADENLLQFSVDVSRYRLPEKYFLISNQLWIHKDHKTAFKALKLLHEQGYTDIHIICTGSTSDTRFPNYYLEIQEYIAELKLTDVIQFLGFIPKSDQITILRGSIAIIQPTLFEGGPGGGSTYDAIAYGVPAIISDIAINREIDCPEVLFFRVQDTNDLAVRMIQLINNPLPRPSIEELKTQRVKNIILGTQFLREIFDKFSINKI
jgi:glycosyltransferase involved in cell wall biosynthesis